MRILRVCVLVGAAVVLACHDAATTETLTATEALSQATERVSTAICDTLSACVASWGPVFPDHDTCLDVLPQEVTFTTEPAHLEVATIDTDALDACVAAELGTGCDVYPSLRAVAACIDTALVGTLAEGACCDNRGGCAPGLTCAGGSYGVCRAPAGADESCAFATCADGLHCGTDDICHALGEVLATCAQTADCADGLTCDSASSTCQGPAGVNASCATLPCDDALVCDSDTLVCIALPGDGEACRDYTCRSDAYCDVDAICRTLPGAGASCIASYACADGLFCDDTQDFTCVVAPSGVALVGERCERASCTLGADCVVTTEGAFCAAHGIADEPCNDAADGAPQCARYYGLVCRSGVCVTAPHLGDSCSASESCAPFADVYCDSANDLCAARIADWQPCSSADSGCALDATCALDSGVCEPDAAYETGGPRCEDS